MKLGFATNLFEISKDSSILTYPVINVEDMMYPGFFDNKSEQEELVSKLNGYKGDLIFDGPYIDLNPGSPEPIIQNITYERVSKALRLAQHCKAREIVFLSTYLPWINVSFYDEGWLEMSTLFWKKTSATFSDMRISLCNTFEFSPDLLIELCEAVGAGNFGLALDLGHAFLYSKVPLQAWFEKIEKRLETIFIHSNEKNGDSHLRINEGRLLKEGGIQPLLAMQKLGSKKLISKPFEKRFYSEDMRFLKSLPLHL